jgi:DNA invertase Pin-like site-specific DNA recombinase
MVKVYGYIRVSTAGQTDSEVTQREQIENYFRELRVRLGDIETDILVERQASGRAGVSGKTRMASREAGAKLLTLLNKGDHVVVLDLSRAFRSHRDAVNCLDDWRNAGVVFHSVRDRIDTSSVTGRLFFQFLSAFVEFERQTIAERTRESVAARKARGQSVGGRPRVGTKTIGPPSQRRKVVCNKSVGLVQRIVRMHENQKMTFEAIAMTFAREGVRNPTTGKIFGVTGIWRLYKRREEILALATSKGTTPSDPSASTAD